MSELKGRNRVRRAESTTVNDVQALWRRIGVAALTSVLALAFACAPASAATRYEANARVGAQQASNTVNARDPEQRGHTIPDPGGNPPHRSDDDRTDTDEQETGSGSGGSPPPLTTTRAGTPTSTRAAPAERQNARPTRPETGGHDALLLLYFGSLLVLAGIGIRMYAD